MELVKKLESVNIFKKISLILLGTLLLTISAKIKVPFYPVPMTMQTFVVVLIGITFGWKLGLATIFAYLFEGAIGLPRFHCRPCSSNCRASYYCPSSCIATWLFH